MLLGVNSVCMLGGAYEGRTGEATGCSMVVLPWCHLQTETGSARGGRDIRVRITMKKNRSTLVVAFYISWMGGMVKFTFHWYRCIVHVSCLLRLWD